VGEVLSAAGTADGRLSWWDIPGWVLSNHGCEGDNAVWRLLAGRARRGVFRVSVFCGALGLGMAACFAPVVLWVPFALIVTGVFLGGIAPSLRFGSKAGRNRPFDEMLLLAADSSDFGDAFVCMLNCALLHTIGLVLIVIVGGFAAAVAGDAAANAGHGVVHVRNDFGETWTLLMFANLALLTLLVPTVWAFYWMALRHGSRVAVLVLVTVFVVPPLGGVGPALLVYLSALIIVPIFVGRCRIAVQRRYPTILAARWDASWV
jgi:hypothetical protein